MSPNKLIQCLCLVFYISSCLALPVVFPRTWFHAQVSQHQRYPREPDSNLRWFGFMRNPWTAAVNSDFPYSRLELLNKRNPDHQILRLPPEIFSTARSYGDSVDAMRDTPQARGIDNRPGASTTNRHTPTIFKEIRTTTNDSVLFDESPSVRAFASTTQGYTTLNVTPSTKRSAVWRPALSGNQKPCLDEDRFCENVPIYPEMEIKSQLAPSLNELTEFFGADILPEPSEAPTVRVRIGSPGQDEMPLCQSESTIRFPKMAKNKEDQWMFIVNVENYTQGIKVEKCRNENGPCQFVEHFPVGSTTYCRQKYTYRKLVAVNEDGKTVTEVFPMPSCCVCQIKLSPLLRMGQKPADPQTSIITPAKDPTKASDDGIVFSEGVQSVNNRKD